MAIQHIQGDLSKMHPTGPHYFKEMPLAHQYCQGHGIELGAAAHNPFGLTDCINVAPWSDDPTHVDYNDFIFYRDAQVNLCGHYAKVDVVGEAESIPLPDHSLDYVLSSHVVEHLPNLIDAFLEWNRVLKPGGVIFMIFPKRDAIDVDAIRPITPLAHFIEDYYAQRTLHDHPIDEGHGIRGHYHVFTLGSMLELIHWCNMRLALQWAVEAVELSDSKVGNGHTVVCRYLSESQSDHSPRRVASSSLPEMSKSQEKASPTTALRKRSTPVGEPISALSRQSRLQQLTDRSWHILANEGVGAFFSRLLKWLGGERRYYKDNSRGS